MTFQRKSTLYRWLEQKSNFFWFTNSVIVLVKVTSFLNVGSNVKSTSDRWSFKKYWNSITLMGTFKIWFFSTLKSIPKWIVVELMIEKCSYSMWPRLLLHKNNNQLRNHYAQLLLCLVSSIFYWEEGLLRFWIHESFITLIMINKSIIIITVSYINLYRIICIYILCGTLIINI